MSAHQHYRVDWSDGDDAFIATLASEPVLIGMDPDPVKALAGLRELVEKSKPFKVGDVITSDKQAKKLPHRAVLMSGKDTVVQVKDLGSVATDGDAYDRREYCSPSSCVRVYKMSQWGMLPAQIIWLPPAADQDGAR